MRTLVVGAGQIGGAVAAALSDPTIASVPWRDPSAARDAVRTQVDAFLRAGAGEPWGLCWSAGAGVVGTPEAQLRVERSYFDEALATIAAAPPATRRLGRLLLASSAGGLHGSAASDVCTEATEPAPTSDYGRSKLLQEQAAAAFAADSGVPVLLGRVSNVYGPGQDLTKPQGFISHLCRAMVRREPFVLTVPPDTVRDFVYNRDVGRRMALWLERPQVGADPVAVKLVVAGRSTTLLQVISVVKAVARVPSRITVSPRRTTDQPARTRFRTERLLDLDAEVPLTSLQEGVHATWAATLRAAAAPRRVS